MENFTLIHSSTHLINTFTIKARHKYNKTQPYSTWKLQTGTRNKKQNNFLKKHKLRQCVVNVTQRKETG